MAIFGGMDALEKWMIIRFTPYQLDVLAKTFVPIILAAKWFVRYLHLLFCLYPSSMTENWFFTKPLIGPSIRLTSVSFPKPAAAGAAKLCS